MSYAWRTDRRCEKGGERESVCVCVFLDSRRNQQTAVSRRCINNRWRQVRYVGRGSSRLVRWLSNARYISPKSPIQQYEKLFEIKSFITTIMLILLLVRDACIFMLGYIHSLSREMRGEVLICREINIIARPAFYYATRAWDEHPPSMWRIINWARAHSISLVLATFRWIYSPNRGYCFIMTGRDVDSAREKVEDG